MHAYPYTEVKEVTNNSLQKDSMNRILNEPLRKRNGGVHGTS